MRCWLIIVPPLCIIVVGCCVPLLCCIDVLITILCTFINVVYWNSAALHGVTWLSTLVTNNMSFSLSCWLTVGLFFSFVMLSFERRSLSNFSFSFWSFCWPVRCSFPVGVDRSFRNLFLCCLSCLSYLYVFLYLFLSTFLCWLLLCPLVLLLHCSWLRLLMMDSAVTCWRLYVLFGIRWLVSVSLRTLVMFLHWGRCCCNGPLVLFIKTATLTWSGTCVLLSDSYCCISYSQLLNDSSKLLVSSAGSSSLVW